MEKFINRWKNSCREEETNYKLYLNLRKSISARLSESNDERLKSLIQQLPIVNYPDNNLDYVY